MDKKTVISNKDLCDEYSISTKADVDLLKESLLSVSGLSEFFKVLADETRTKIVHLLSCQELCVCDLALIMGMSLPAISHHLRLLKMMKLVSYRRQGKRVFYRLNDKHIVDLITVAREHFHE